MTDRLMSSVAGSVLQRSSRSIMYLGRSTLDEEICLAADTLKTHMFVSGSTGSGKTEFLINMLTQVIGWGSGAVFIDGKGDISFFAKMHLIATALGREQDLLLLNFMQSARSDSENMSSHSINPFSILSADQLSLIMDAMLPKVYGDGGIWRERAVALMNVIINALVWLRDFRDEPLTISRIRKYLVLDNLIDLADYLMESGSPVFVRDELAFYLETLPGFQAERAKRQSQTTREQHGFLSMQWTRSTTLLCTQFGHIFDTETPDIDVRDVIYNRRILIILLPSLEQSSSDIYNIGALIVGMLKSMMGEALRTPVEGTFGRVVDERATNATFPFMLFMDEVGQYLTPGMGMMAQQARSLNIGLVFATQDFDSLHFANPKEVEAIISNTNTKVFMKAENPNAIQISRTLQTFVDAQNRDELARDKLAHAKTSLNMARNNRSERVEMFHRSDNLKVSNVEFERLHADATAYIDDLTNRPLFALAGLLRGFSSGQMLITHGSTCVQGVGNYIPVTGPADQHVIKLQRFVHLEGYGTDIEDRRRTKVKSDEIISSLRIELQKNSVGYDYDTLVELKKYAENPDKNIMVLSSSTPVPAAIDSKLFTGRNGRTVWAKYLFHKIIGHFDNTHRSSYQKAVESLDEGLLTLAPTKPAASTVPPLAPFDLLATLKKAEK